VQHVNQDAVCPVATLTPIKFRFVPKASSTLAPATDATSHGRDKRSPTAASVVIVSDTWAPPHAPPRTIAQAIDSKAVNAVDVFQQQGSNIYSLMACGRADCDDSAAGTAAGLTRILLVISRGAAHLCGHLLPRPPPVIHVERGTSWRLFGLGVGKTP
jgi:hypothetical protein